jgi:aminoglycoside phosphotransferase family enzyme
MGDTGKFSGEACGFAPLRIRTMLSSMIKDLLDPASLPDATKNVSVVQTHISVVIVADDFVYKIKKPVNFGFLDFLTLEKRAYYCRQELELNRRLAEDIYLDVIPVRSDGKRYSLRSQAGEVVEYAVKMRRVPEERLMKSLFEKGALTEGHLKQLARVLARFHSEAGRSEEIDRYGEPDMFRVNTEENFDQVRRYVGTTVGQKEFQHLRSWTEGFYRKNRRLFFERIKAGKIRDCHGDLHMEHVCFTEKVSIIDCIEFNERFRYSDAVADIAFLLMDLEYRGGDGFSRFLWDEYKGLSRDEGVESLLTFYKVYRAFVRGKVNSFQLDDPNIGNQEKERARERATRYFELASTYTRQDLPA